MVASMANRPPWASKSVTSQGLFQARVATSLSAGETGEAGARGSTDTSPIYSPDHLNMLSSISVCWRASTWPSQNSAMNTP